MRPELTRRRHRPAARPRLVDLALAGVSLAVAVAGLLDTGRGRGPGDGGTPSSGDVSAVAVVLVVLAAAALLARRDRPVPVAPASAAGVLGAVLAGGSDPLVSAPLLVALFTLGRLTTTVTTVTTLVVTGALYVLALAAVEGAFLDGRGDSPALTVLALGGAATAMGVAVRSQQSALAAARARAVQAETTREEEAQRRVTDERLRITRELHDVVAHHISVVNVQAGVARHLLVSDPDQARTALGLVRDASKTVLTEMSSVLGLLRTEDGASDTEPAPGLSRLPALVESLRSAGLDLTWDTTGDPRTLAPLQDLTAYRVVQEGLTNALRYGDGRARLVLDHHRRGVTVTVTNPVAADPPAPGGGHGLVGVRERVEAVGGRSHAGPDGPGSWTLYAEVPGTLS